MSATPILRFSDKNGQPFPEWESMFIGDYLTKKSIKQVPTDDAPLMSFVAHRGVVEKGDKYDRSHLVKSKDKKYKRTDLNDFIYSSNNLDVGSIGLNKHGSAVISEVYEIFSINDAANPDFISEVIQMPETIDKIIRFRQGCLYGQYKVYPEDFLDVEINMPTKEEQDKVAAFLSLYDKKIENQMAKVEALETRRKGLLQQIFSQEIRFKADDGSEFEAWDELTIADLFTKVKGTNKDGVVTNVITNSAVEGLIPQRDFFEKDIAVEGNTDKYTIIHKGDFVYNPRKSTSAPYGPFNCYRLEEPGIVSPLYSCLKLVNEAFTPYLLYYFASPAWYSYIYHNGNQGGARHDRVGMTDDLLMGIPIGLPCIEEQKKISDFFALIDAQLKIEKDKLEAIKLVKKGLLQQMFV